ncbi:MAG: cyclic lactone autoinducer peptide [Clostridia bacterium]|nr:cyclic lactone autoinducer peptide [Clostridia bacterium]
MKGKMKLLGITLLTFLSTFIMLLSQIKAAHACTLFLYQPKVPKSLRK